MFLLLHFGAAHAARAGSWRVCDVAAHYGARGDGVSSDTAPIRAALAECNEVVLESVGSQPN